MFLNPPPPAEVGRKYFAEAYASDHNSNAYFTDEFKERVSDLRMEFISEKVRTTGRLLDVGCGKGHFVAVACRRGWDAWGVELDEGACLYARETLGLESVLNGSMDHPLLPMEFDVVTLWDVIEHVPDPISVLRDAAKRLRPGGLLVVRTANIRSRAFDRNRSGWWAFGSDHRFYFSPHSLARTAELAGFTDAEVYDREPVERPGRRRSVGIADTSLAAGARALVATPAKVLKIGVYVQQQWRRYRGGRKYGAHYSTSIMTFLARNAPASSGSEQATPSL